MQNAISTDQSVLILVNDELNEGRALKDIFDRGVVLIDYDKNRQPRWLLMKGTTLKRRYYSAKRKFNIDHIKSRQCQFMGRDLPISPTFEPPVIPRVGRPPNKITTKAI